MAARDCFRGGHLVFVGFEGLWCGLLWFWLARKARYFFVSSSITSKVWPGRLNFSLVPETGKVLSVGTMCLGSVIELVSAVELA